MIESVESRYIFMFDRSVSPSNYLKRVDASGVPGGLSISVLRERFEQAVVAVREYERWASEGLVRHDDVRRRETIVFSRLADVLNFYTVLSGEYSG